MPDEQNLDQSKGRNNLAVSADEERNAKEAVEKEAALAALDDDGGAPEVVPDENEEQARPKGWTDADEWEDAGKDPKQWVDAGEFLRRGPLYDVMHTQNREIKELKGQLKTLADWHAKTEKHTYDRAYKELKAQYKSQMKGEDLEGALETQDRIEELREQKPPEDADVAEVPEENVKAWEAWRLRNGWYGGKSAADQEKSEFAHGIGLSIEASHPDWPISQVLDEVTNKVNQHYGTAKKKRTAAPVGAPRQRAKEGSEAGDPVPGRNRLDMNDPNIAQPYKDLVESGLMTHKQWMTDYVAAGGRLKEA